MVDKKRKIVLREIGYIDFEGMTAVEIIDYLKSKIEEYGKEIYVDKVYGSYGDGDYLALHDRVPETDDQYNKRIRDEERQEAQRREYDLRTLKELQAKYGH